MRTSKLTFPLGAAAATALVAGCGGGSPSTTTSASNASGSPAQAAYHYSACMRAHGVPSFPDPHVSQSGNQITIMAKLPPGTKGSPAFDSAQHACAGILPPPGNSGPGLSPAQQHARAVHLVAFAQCIRNHGVGNFPDPTPQGQLTREMLAAAGVNIHQTNVIAAARGCVSASGGFVTQAAISRALTGS